MTSGGVVSPTDPIRVPQCSAEEVRVVTAEATRRGAYTAIRSIEHGNPLDDPSVLWRDPARLAVIQAGIRR